MDTNATFSGTGADAPSSGGADAAFVKRAWTMVAVAMLGTMCCSTSVILINVGVFMRPLEESFGWSRGAIAMSLSIAAIAMAACNPLVGRFIDRFGVRPVLIGSLIMYGAATAATPFLIKAFGLWGLYISYALIAGLGAGSNVIAYVRLLSGWFSGPMNKSRGLALGISSAGIPLGTIVSSPLGVMLIEHAGWAGGFWGLALLPLLVGLPLALLMVRNAPHETTAQGAAKGQDHLPGMTIKEAMATPAFWLLSVMVLFMASALQGVGIHTAPLLSDLGLVPAMVALILAVDGVLGIVGRVGAGFLFDRFFAPYAAFFIFGIAAVSAYAFFGFPGAMVAIVATFFITIGSGAESDFIGYMVGRYFGLKNYGQIFGAIYAMFMVGIAVGPLLFGIAYDVWGDYKMSFLIAGILLTIICAMLPFLPKFPKEDWVHAPATKAAE